MYAIYVERDGEMVVYTVSANVLDAADNVAELLDNSEPRVEVVEQ